MFPFSYSTRIVVPSVGEQLIDTEKILIKFKEQFDDPKFTDEDTITFGNFNFFLKRHSWLSNGVLKITKKENQVCADLRLNFYFTPIAIIFISFWLIVMNIEQVWFSLFGIAVFWTFYLMLYLWTTLMFKLSVRRTIGHHLFLSETGLESNEPIIIVKDTCPGCGNKIKEGEIECSECSLHFG